MKSTVKMLAAVIVTVVIGTACSKKEITPEAAVTTVALETSLKTGETYELDLSSYNSKDTRATIVKHPTHANESMLIGGTCQTPGSYRYTAGSSAATDQVILQLVKRGKCNKSEETTNIALTIKTEEETPVIQQ